MAAVSYTHLDVYKRQYIPEIQRIAKRIAFPYAVRVGGICEKRDSRVPFPKIAA